jgi:DNA-binding NarL/FixJ family response regulator
MEAMCRPLPVSTMDSDMFGFRTIVADDDRHIRSAAVDVLEADSRFTVVAAVSDGHEAVRQAGLVVADLVLFDVRMPGGGAATLQRLCSMMDPPVVVVFSATTEPMTVATMLAEGANGFVAKGTSATDMCDLLVRCMAGDLVVSGADTRAVLRALSRRAAHPSRQPEPVEG